MYKFISVRRKRRRHWVWGAFTDYRAYGGAA